MSTENGNWREWPKGWQVEHVLETGSTNTDLVERAQNGALMHTVLAADFQTSGRGRLDRSWEALRGANLLVSILFRDQQRPQHNFSQIVGLAASSACEQLTGVRPDLKWPNDLLVSGRKLSGLLASGGADFVVVGIGINVNWAPAEAIALKEVAPDKMLHPADVLRAMLVGIDEIEALSPDELHDLYSASLATLGSQVRIERSDGGTLVGQATSVERDGRLVVVDETGAKHRVDTGDVIHLRKA